MKNNTLHKVNKQKKTGGFFKSGSVCGFCLLAGLLASQQGNAQFSNKGNVTVKDGTILSVHEDYKNQDSATFTNDGQVYIFKNWNNDGTVDFTESAAGKTFFIGKADQYIEGKKRSDFQNLEFNNTSDITPFYLGTEISVNNKAEFTKGIVDGVELPGALVIFKDNAIHDKTGDQSFVDGKVQKTGKKEFKFPVGSGTFYRPSIHAATSDNNIYTTQYFLKNSAELHSHESRDKKTILEINNAEYWEVKQDKGAEKIVLSLTLDSDTTPSQFFTETKGVKVAIVRWDDVANEWVNEKGQLGETGGGEAYSKIITAQVGGYGLFTIALVKDEEAEIDDLVVYNAVSPNGDGKNDKFLIEGINKYPNNTVEIYNRWGVKVYEANGYNENDRMFEGYSDGRATVNRGEKLPTGTYFYILKYSDGKKSKEKSGYLYINNQ